MLSVYDWDAVGKDDFLGEARIPFHGLRIDGNEVWYKLEPRPKGKQKIAVSGGLSDTVVTVTLTVLRRDLCGIC